MDISLFFFNYYFKGTSQIQKIVGKKKTRKELKKKVIKTKERKKNDMKKKKKPTKCECA